MVFVFVKSRYNNQMHKYNRIVYLESYPKADSQGKKS